jgi:peptide chain release factor subunit 1
MITVIEPIKPINIFTYRCDSVFLTDPLKEMLEATEKYGFLVVDGNGCLFATVQGNTETVLHKFSEDLPKKHGRGGQSALRFARLRLEARHNYVTKCCELATKLFVDPDTNKPNVKGLVTAGFADFKEQVAKALDPRLQSVLVDAVDIAYGGVQGLHQAIELTSETLKGITLVSQKKVLSSFFEQLHQDTGRACYGIEDTLAALDSGAVEKLLVWEGVSTIRYIMQNSKTAEQKIVFAKPDEQPQVADSTEGVWEVADSTTLVDWFAEHFKDFGAELELVSDATAEGSQFAKGFGGVGGILRYKMELPSSTFIAEEDHQDQEESQQTSAEGEEEDFWN